MTSDTWSYFLLPEITLAEKLKSVNVVVSVNVIGWRNTCYVRFTHTRCYALLFCETHYLVCEITTVSERR